MDLRVPEWLFPVIGGILARISNYRGPRRHPLLDLGRETFQRFRRHSSAFRPWKVRATLNQASPAGLMGCAAEHALPRAS